MNRSMTFCEGRIKYTFFGVFNGGIYCVKFTYSYDWCDEGNHRYSSSTIKVIVKVHIFAVNKVSFQA